MRHGKPERMTVCLTALPTDLLFVRFVDFVFIVLEFGYNGLGFDEFAAKIVSFGL